MTGKTGFFRNIIIFYIFIWYGMNFLAWGWFFYVVFKKLSHRGGKGSRFLPAHS